MGCENEGSAALLRRHVDSANVHAWTLLEGWIFLAVLRHPASLLLAFSQSAVVQSWSYVALTQLSAFQVESVA